MDQFNIGEMWTSVTDWFCRILIGRFKKKGERVLIFRYFYCLNDFKKYFIIILHAKKSRPG